MGDKQIHLRVPKDIFETSKKLKNLTVKVDDLSMFRLYSGKSSWHSFVYQMGFILLRNE